MPYAQVHYPFDQRRTFMDTFPADFIAEGIDQTRGWFYTLLVVSTALFDQPPFRNLIVNGIVLSSTGEKMSKSKKNYPDPRLIFNEYGADALRLYLITSPVVRGESLKFKEEGVRDILKDVFLPWYNALRLLVQSCDQVKIDKKVTFIYDNKRLYSSMSLNTNVMDTWIVSYTQTLLDFVKQEMDAYRLYTVVPRLVKYIDMLTNWYVKLNKRRFKVKIILSHFSLTVYWIFQGETTLEDCLVSLNVLCYILLTMAKLMAPFTPFLAEYMYQILRKLMPESSPASAEQDLSVHFQMIPKSQFVIFSILIEREKKYLFRKSLVNKSIERAVAGVQTVIGMGRVVRERKVVPMKYPLPEFVVIHKDASVLKDVESLEDFVREVCVSMFLFGIHFF
jgi:isoleucyl-tRNA synthetase